MPVGAFVGAVLHQEVDIRRLRTEARAATKRLAVFLQFSAKSNPSERGDALAWATGANFTVIHGEKVLPGEYFETMGAHSFVLCPRGQGHDSFRIFEALLMGSIPIIINHVFAEAYAGLPVVRVESWTDITLPKLAEWWRVLGPQVAALDVELSGDHWWSKVHAAVQSNPEHHPDAVDSSVVLPSLLPMPNVIADYRAPLQFRLPVPGTSLRPPQRSRFLPKSGTISCERKREQNKARVNRETNPSFFPPQFHSKTHNSFVIQQTLSLRT